MGSLFIWHASHPYQPNCCGHTLTPETGADQGSTAQTQEYKFSTEQLDIKDNVAAYKADSDPQEEAGRTDTELQQEMKEQGRSSPGSAQLVTAATAL